MNIDYFYISSKVKSYVKHENKLILQFNRLRLEIITADLLLKLYKKLLGRLNNIKQKHNENMMWLYQRIIKEFASRILHSNESMIDILPGRIVEIIFH